MTTLHHTSVNLPENVREELVRLLNRRVGLFTDLYVQTKLAHWNVRGPHFIAYHELFDSIASHLLVAQDSMAERAAALGGQAGMTVQAVAEESGLGQWPIETRQDSAVIHLVGDRLARAAGQIRQDIDTAANLGDADTADLFTEVSRQLDQDLWFVEAHYTE